MTLLELTPSESKIFDSGHYGPAGTTDTSQGVGARQRRPYFEMRADGNTKWFRMIFPEKFRIHPASLPGCSGIVGIIPGVSLAFARETPG